MEWLTVKPLEPGDVSTAFPLVRLHHKDLDLVQWADYARRILVNNEELHEQGFLAAYDNHDVIHGILQYEVRRDLEGNGRVTATTIMSCGFLDRHRVRVTTTLIQSLNTLARELDCERVAVEVPAEETLPATANLSSLLETSGHQATETIFSRRF
jgi:hypothetical protein